jgi:hypothetical protein
VAHKVFRESVRELRLVEDDFPAARKSENYDTRGSESIPGGKFASDIDCFLMHTKFLVRLELITKRYSVRDKYDWDQVVWEPLQTICRYGLHLRHLRLHGTGDLNSNSRLRAFQSADGSFRLLDQLNTFHLHEVTYDTGGALFMPKLTLTVDLVAIELTTVHSSCGG